MRRSARALAVAALSAAALGSLLLADASAARPGWGPDHLPYRAGLVCADAKGEVALASWPSAATAAPAFALGPVTAAVNGAHATEPAVDQPATRPLAGPAAATVAALLAGHGGTRDPVVAAQVAGALLGHAAGGAGVTALTAGCLTERAGGVGTATALWTEAARLAGPYTLRLHLPGTKLVLGRSAPVTAVVTAASGAPVPDLQVSFSPAETGAAVARGSAVTDAHGIASTSLIVQPGSTLRAVHLRARADVPGTPVTMTSPGRVPLVAAGAPRALTGAGRVLVDTTADPRLHTGVDRTVVLPGTPVRPTIAVSGLRGHAGAATLSVSGPLPIDAHRGCRGYAGGALPPTPAATSGAMSPPRVDVPNDGTFAARPLTLTRPGCYVLSSAIATSNAIPNVRRQGDRAIVAVAPVHVSVAPSGQGVAVAGPLTALASVAGTVPARLTDVTAGLLGPRASDDGSCAAVHFPSYASPITATRTRDGWRLASRPVTTTGCYGFRVLGTVQIPNLGSVPLAWSGPVTATALVLSPTTSVDRLSTSAVVAGGRLTAAVTVSGSWTQPGALRLVLRHLPYDWRGCFGRDWTHASTASITGPLMPTNGDGTYRVQTPTVPSEGCWTVVPVLTLSRNKQLSLTDTAPIDPMTAFTALRPAASPVAQRLPLQLETSDGAGQILGAGAGMVVLLIVAVGSTLSIALRDR